MSSRPGAVVTILDKSVSVGASSSVEGLWIPFDAVPLGDTKVTVTARRKLALRKLHGETTVVLHREPRPLLLELSTAEENGDSVALDVQSRPGTTIKIEDTPVTLDKDGRGQWKGSARAALLRGAPGKPAVAVWAHTDEGVEQRGEMPISLGSATAKALKGEVIMVAKKGLPWAAELQRNGTPRPTLLIENYNDYCPRDPDCWYEWTAGNGLTRLSDAEIIVLAAEKNTQVGDCGLYKADNGELCYLYRMRKDILADAYEARTGKKLGSTRLNGGSPRACKHTEEGPCGWITGDDPDPRAVGAWIGTLTGPLPK